MPERVKWFASERVDLTDLKRASSGATADEIQHLLIRMFQGVEPGGAILDGFYVEVPDQSGSNKGVIRVVNGFALDRICERVYKASGEEPPINLFEDVNVSKEIVLVGAGATHYIEVEFLLQDGAKDARAFWDASFENGTDPSGDPRPDGREISMNVETRGFPEWRVVHNTTRFKWNDDIETGSKTVRIPIAIIPLNVGSEVDTTAVIRETARSTVIASPSGAAPSTFVRVANARLFQITDELDFVSKTGLTLISNAGITGIDYANNVIEVSDDIIAAGVDATDSVQASIIATSKYFLADLRGQNSTSGDQRNKFFAKDGTIEVTGVNPEAIIADPTGEVPVTQTFDNSDTILPNTQIEGPFRTDTKIDTFLDWVRAVEFVIREMKHGVSPSSTADGASDYLIEGWTGTHSLGEVDPTRNIPAHGSLAEVANARAYHPLGDVSRRVYHDTLQEHVRAIRRETITVGDGVGTFGDFNGSQGLANALHYINDEFTDSFGTLFVKNGIYDLDPGVITIPGVSYYTLPANWSLVGEGQNSTQIIVDDSIVFTIDINGDAGTVRQGSRVKEIMFRSKAIRDGAMVRFDVAATGTALLGIPYAEVANVTFLNTFGTNGPLTDDGMVVAQMTTASTVVVRNPLAFRHCTFSVGESSSEVGQLHFEWTPTGGDYSRKYSIPCHFDSCNFVNNRATGTGPTNYGVKIVADRFDVSHRLGEFKFSDCIFEGAGTVTSPNKVAWIQAIATVADAAILQVTVTGCVFRGLNSSNTIGGTNIVAYLGGGVVFDQQNGKLNVMGCTFEDLQFGVWAASGKETLTGNVFNHCSAGVLVGKGALVSFNKLQITGCNFVGSMSEVIKDTEALISARSVGIIFSDTATVFTYGSSTENASDLDPLIMSSVKIAGCNFTEIGCGISAYPAVASLAGSPADNLALFEHFEVTGCNFYGIPGCAIDTGFIIGITVRMAVVGTLIVNSCNFTWCGWNNHRDVFVGTAFPTSEITHMHEMCVSTYAHRVFVTGNTFNAIGLFAYSNESPFGEFPGGVSPKRFLACVGNDPLSPTRTVVVKGNTFNGYSNVGNPATDPFDLTSDVAGVKTQSWAGCFWVGAVGMTARDNAVSVSICENTIGGDYRQAIAGDGSDSYGQSGFWVGPTTDFFAMPGSLRFMHNDFELNQGQHGLFTSLDNGNGSGSIAWNDISILGNLIKSWNAGTNSNNQGGFPSAASVGQIHLIHLEGWRGRGDYLIGVDGALPVAAEGVNDLLTLPGIVVSGNELTVEGPLPAVNSSGHSLLLGERSGVLLTYAAIEGSPNAVFKANTFKNCSLTLGDSTGMLSDMAYKYVVQGNTFAASIPASVGGSFRELAGFFRGLFCINHAHGVFHGGGPVEYLEADRSSMLRFSDNVVMNGTAVIRAGNNNAYSWLDCRVGYVLYLTGNSFYGRGGGLGTFDPSGGSATVPDVKSCFDFLGGDPLDDYSPPVSGGNLESWIVGASGLANKVIIIAMNVFPPAVGESSNIVNGADTVVIGNAATLAGDTTLGIVHGTDYGSLIIAGNMQMVKEGVGGGGEKSWNVRGAQ